MPAAGRVLREAIGTLAHMTDERHGIDGSSRCSEITQRCSARNKRPICYFARPDEIFE